MAHTRSRSLIAKRRFWEKHIEKWKASGLIQAEYCRLQKLKVHRFIYWKTKFLDKADESASFVQVPLAPLFLPPANERTPNLRVSIYDKFKIEVDPGFDATTLRQLIHTLGQI